MISFQTWCWWWRSYTTNSRLNLNTYWCICISIPSFGG